MVRNVSGGHCNLCDRENANKVKVWDLKSCKPSLPCHGKFSSEGSWLLEMVVGELEWKEWLILKG